MWARSRGAYLCIGCDDADRLGLQQCGMVELVSGSCRVQLRVLVRSHSAEGSVGVYWADEVSRFSLADRATVHRLQEDDSVLVRSRQMFADLVISDGVPGRAL